ASRVELLAAFLELVREHVADRRDDGARMLEERGCDLQPAAPAAEEAQPDRGGGRGAPYQPGLEDRDAGGDRRAQEPAAARPALARVTHGNFLPCRLSQLAFRGRGGGGGGAER